jgi:hypothetical protein
MWYKGGWKTTCEPPETASEDEKRRIWLLVDGKPSRILTRASHHRKARTKGKALRLALKAEALGYESCVTQFIYYKGKRYMRDYYLRIQ